jgi:hypothetical protein
MRAMTCGEARAKGLCTRCKRRPATGSRCEPCRIRINIRANERRRGGSAGLGPHAPNPLSEKRGFVNAIAACAVHAFAPGDKLVSARWKAPYQIVLVRPSMGCVVLRQPSGGMREFERLPKDVTRVA